MIYTSEDGLAFQRKDRCYRFMFTSRWVQLKKEIRRLDSDYKPIGPTILVEWEE